jgi:spermidine synthase
VLWVLMRQVVGRLIIDDQVVETVADGGTSAPSRFCLKGRLVRQRSLDIAFAFSGFAALALQVVWQRLIAIHAGVDLASTTTVVAAFMAGLGLGSVVGGRLAPRLSARRAAQAYALSTLGVAAFAAVSVPLLYGGSAALASADRSAGAAFLFHFALLLVPTSLMGLSLPLLTHAVAAEGAAGAASVGRLAALNTLGAAAGAFVTTWWVVGSFGFGGAIALAATLELAAAALVLMFYRPSTDTAAVTSLQRSAPAWGWHLVFALTGAVALGFEIVFFRIVDALMRSNSYTFGHVLALYLVLYAVGNAVGARWVKRTEDPGHAFALAQLTMALTAGFGVWLLVSMPSLWGMRQLLESYFATDGYLAGPSMPTSGKTAMKLLFAHVTGPLLVMGVPVFCMGLSFPLVMGAVVKPGTAVATRVGTLQLANVAGNVVGSLLTGFVLLDAVGTMGTVRVLSSLLAVGGVALGLWAARGKKTLVATLGATSVAMVALLPDNTRFWAFLHAAPLDRFTLVEERSCVNALVREPTTGEEILFLNATSQNGWPFDDFHVLIGLLPALLQEKPGPVLAIGLGAGSTAWGLLQDPRVTSVRCVELCGGEVTLLAELGRRGATELTQLMNDPRARIDVGDGRKALLEPGQYGVISVDALRPNSAFSGNVYSVDFYQLVQRRLAPQGVFAQWVPTERVLEGARRVFGHVVTVEIPGGRGRFFLASNQPMRFDRQLLVSRFQAAAAHLSLAQRQRIETILKEAVVQTVRAGETLPSALPNEAVNTDLFARDEYFLN